MIWTNKTGVSDEFAKAIIDRQSQYSSGDGYSATELLNSPRQVQLARRHTDLETDVADYFASWVGHLIHDAIEMDLPRARMKFGDAEVSGAADWYNDGVIKDFKTTTVWSVIYKDKYPKWEQQLNMYAYLYSEVFGWEVNEVAIEVYITDWQYSRSLREKDYPNSRQFMIPMKLWSKKEQAAFLEGLAETHSSFEDCPDDDLPHCTAEEVWEKPSVWAIHKKGRKSALKLCDSEEEAQEYVAFKWSGMGEDDGIYIDHRQGARTKCERFCTQSVVCSQWKEFNAKI